MEKLWELTAAYKELSENKELTEEQIADTLESLEDAMEVKIDNVAKVIDNNNDRIGYLTQRKKYFSEKVKEFDSEIKALSKNNDRLNKNIKDAMEATGSTKIVADNHVIKIQKNPPRVDVFDASVISEEFYKHTIDTVSIKNALKNGEDVPGAQLVQDTRVVIK